MPGEADARERSEGYPPTTTTTPATATATATLLEVDVPQRCMMSAAPAALIFFHDLLLGGARGVKTKTEGDDAVPSQRVTLDSRCLSLAATFKYAKRRHHRRRPVRTRAPPSPPRASPRHNPPPLHP